MDSSDPSANGSTLSWLSLILIPGIFSMSHRHQPTHRMLDNLKVWLGIRFKILQNFPFKDKYFYFIHVLPILPWTRAFPYKFPGKTQLWPLFNRPGEYCPSKHHPRECQGKIPFQTDFSRQNTDLKERLRRKTVVLQGFRDKIHLHMETLEGFWHIQKEAGVSLPAEFGGDRQELVVCLNLFSCWPSPAPVSPWIHGFHQAWQEKWALNN